jgi:hypothetical protein
MALLGIDPLLGVPCPDYSNERISEKSLGYVSNTKHSEQRKYYCPCGNWNFGEVGKRGAGLLRLFGVFCPIFNAGERLVLEGLELEARDSLGRELLGYSSKFQPDGYFEVGVVAEDQLVVGGRAFLVGLKGKTGWLAVFKRLRALLTKLKATVVLSPGILRV